MTLMFKDFIIPAFLITLCILNYYYIKAIKEEKEKEKEKER